MDFLYVSHRADGAIKLQRLGGAEKAPEVARGKAGAGLSTRCQPRSRAHAARGTPFGTRSQLARPDGNVRAEQGRSKRDRTTDAVADGDRLTRDSSCPR